MKSASYTYVTRAATALFVLALGYYAGHYAFPPEVTRINIRENSPEYKYINPLIVTETLGVKFPEYSAMQRTLEDFTDSSIRRGDAETASIYFRDLNSGKWTGVNEEEPYAPSSMLKVVVMLAYLDREEDEPGILDRVLPYRPDVGGDGEHFQGPSLTKGSHTVRELLENMIVNSDNAALQSLGTANPILVQKTGKTLRLPTASDPSQDFMSTRAFSIVFRALYNASYLSKNASEQALKLLTETTFQRGLVSGVPKGTLVAHKFGERTIAGRAATKELHDCGIVYVPSAPYFLCVMTKGSDFDKLASVISGISHIAYSEVASTK